VIVDVVRLQCDGFLEVLDGLVSVAARERFAALRLTGLRVIGLCSDRE
jgi:hypothetical protein